MFVVTRCWLTCLYDVVHADTCSNHYCLKVLPAVARQLRERLDFFWGSMVSSKAAEVFTKCINALVQALLRMSVARGGNQAKISPDFGVFLKLYQKENEKVLKNLLRQQREKCLDTVEFYHSNFESILFPFAFRTSFIFCFLFFMVFFLIRFYSFHLPPHLTTHLLSLVEATNDEDSIVNVPSSTGCTAFLGINSYDSLFFP